MVCDAFLIAKRVVSLIVFIFQSNTSTRFFIMMFTYIYISGNTPDSIFEMRPKRTDKSGREAFLNFGCIYYEHTCTNKSLGSVERAIISVFNPNQPCLGSVERAIISVFNL